MHSQCRMCEEHEENPNHRAKNLSAKGSHMSILKQDLALMCLLPPNASPASWHCLLSWHRQDSGRGYPEPVRHETPSKQPEECLRLNFGSLLGNICPSLWLGKGMWGGGG